MNEMDRYAALEARLRELNGSVESMAFNFECLARTNDAVVGLSESISRFVQATSAQANLAATFAMVHEVKQCNGAASGYDAEPRSSPDPVSMQTLAFCVLGKKHWCAVEAGASRNDIH